MFPTPVQSGKTLSERKGREEDGTRLRAVHGEKAEQTFFQKLREIAPTVRHNMDMNHMGRFMATVDYAIRFELDFPDSGWIKKTRLPDHQSPFTNKSDYLPPAQPDQSEQAGTEEQGCAGDWDGIRVFKDDTIHIVSIAGHAILTADIDDHDGGGESQ